MVRFFEGVENVTLLGTNSSCLQINFCGGKGTVGAAVVVCRKA